MHILVDGKEVEFKNDVKITATDIYVEENGNGKEGLAALTVTLTHEGIILDLENEDGENIGTDSQTYVEIAFDMP